MYLHLKNAFSDSVLLKTSPWKVCEACLKNRNVPETSPVSALQTTVTS